MFWGLQMRNSSIMNSTDSQLKHGTHVATQAAPEVLDQASSHTQQQQRNWRLSISTHLVGILLVFCWNLFTVFRQEVGHMRVPQQPVLHGCGVVPAQHMLG